MKKRILTNLVAAAALGLSVQAVANDNDIDGLPAVDQSTMDYQGQGTLLGMQGSSPSTSSTSTSVPEPATLALLGLGTVLLGVARRKR